ncbi:MAG: hypothetical protein JKY43_11950 [Phycisphaerales bacterium]|nr:hypothetical protein [Phycisphaerales bacterium]
MKTPLALTLAALASAATMSHAQVSTFSYVGEITDISDGLNLYGSATVGSEATGTFTLDLDADAILNPGGGDLVNYFEALGLNAAFEEFGMGAISPDDSIIAFIVDNHTYENDEGEMVTVDILEISWADQNPGLYDFGGIHINFVGTEDWFEGIADLPNPLSMGFENLLSAEVVIEFFQVQGGGGGEGGKGGGTLVSSRAVINIASMANAAGTVATIGCQSYQFAAPVATFDFFDVSSFLSEFSIGSLDADINNDGNLDFFDISVFLSQAQTQCSN